MILLFSPVSTPPEIIYKTDDDDDDDDDDPAPHSETIAEDVEDKSAPVTSEFPAYNSCSRPLQRIFRLTETNLESVLALTHC